MKAFILLHLALTVFNISLTAQYQDYQCGTEYPLSMLIRLKEAQDSISQFDGARGFTSYPVSAFIIRRSDGTGGMDPSDFLQALDHVNTLYAPANIGFFLCHEITFVDNDNFYDFTKLQENNLFNANHVNNSINLYFPNTLSTPSGTPLCGYAYFPGWGDAAVVDRICALDGSSLAHEIGHIFGLFHTHGLNNTQQTDELVNTLNCAVGGDDLCDTPADPNIYLVVNDDCVYTGNETDSNGDPYTPDVTNIMSYAPKHCKQSFTPQQYQKIAYVAHYLRDEMACTDLSADFTATPLLSLCENQVTVLFHYTGMGATHFYWDVDGDGETDYTGSDPVHEYNELGNYFVTLTVSNGVDTIFKTLPSLVQLLDQFSGPFSDIAEEEIGQRSVINPDGNYTWEIKDLGPSNPYGKAWLMDNYHYNNSGESDHLLIGPFNLSQLAEPNLKFDISYAPYNSIREDALSVQISVNCGESYQQIYYKSGLELGTGGGYQTLQWVPISTNEWRTEEIPLEMFAGYDEVTIRFTNITDFGNNLYLDNISVNGQLALSLDLLSFQGKSIDENNNLLSWETANEDQVDYFILQGSEDGITFNDIENIAAQNAIHNVYRYEHRNVNKSIYYRLIAINNDRSNQLSSIVFIENESTPAFSVYPNPVSDKLYLNSADKAMPDNVKIYDMQGDIVIQLSGSDQKTISEVNVASLNPGIYTIVSGNSSGIRFIKLNN